MPDDNPWRDWANNAAGRIRKSDEDRRLELIRRAQESEAIQREAPFLWQETRRQFRLAFDALAADIRDERADLRWDDRSSNSFQISSPPLCSVDVSFDHKSLSMEIAGSVYRVKLSQTDVPIWQYGGSDARPFDVVKLTMENFVSCLSKR